MPVDDYKRAQELIVLASEHALQGNHDTARTVLRAAFADGNLHRGDRRVGRLHYLAVLALVDAREGKAASAAANLTKALGELQHIRKKEQPDILARCYQAMTELPHNKDIQRRLGQAKAEWSRSNYVKAYEKIREAKRIRVKYRSLTPPSIETEIAEASTQAMIHLMENNRPQDAVAITAELQKRGLIERS